MPAEKSLSKQTTVLEAISFFSAALVLFGGWLGGFSFLTRLSPDYAAMVPSTALLFLLLSGGLLYRDLSGRPSRLLLTVVASILVIVAALDFLLLSTGISNGIDAFVAPEVEAFRTVSMSPATAIGFLLAAACLFTLNSDKHPYRLAYVWFGTMGLVFSGVALIGYLFDASALYHVWLFTSMALHTALCFHVLFVCLLLQQPTVGWPAVLLGSGEGSAGVRRLFPVVVFAPLLFCLLTLVATELGVLDANFRLSLLAIGTIVALAGSVFHNAIVANRVQLRLLDVNEELRATVANRDTLLREIYHRVKNNLQITIALINIGARNVEDAAAQEVLKDTARRINALGQVHQYLVGGPMPSNVEAPEFLRGLCESVLDGQGGDVRNISFELDSENIILQIDTAVTLGLLLNELLTNVCKHAYPDSQGGTIRVAFFSRSEGGVELVIADDGKGTGTHSEGTGLSIVRGLAMQLEGRVVVEAGTKTARGTTVRVVLPNESSDTRKCANQ